MLGELEDKPQRLVVADLEAGLGTVIRADAGQIDLAVIVVEPYVKSMEVARRLEALCREKEVPRWILLANKIRADEDVALIRSALGREPDVVVPEDAEIAAADLGAEAPFDRNIDSPAVRRLRELASRVAADRTA